MTTLIEGPHSHMLDRQHARAEVERAYGQHLNLLKEIIDYGTHLLLRLWKSSDGATADAVIIGALLRNVLRGLDTAHICIEHGQQDGAQIAIRSALEASWGTSWVIQENTQRRAGQYFVSYLRQQRLWALRVTPDTAEHAAFVRGIETEFDPLRMKGSEKYEPTRLTPETVAVLLDLDEFRDINLTFERSKAARRGAEPMWYQPGGPRSIAEMAAAVGKTAQYRVFYHGFSASAHGSALREALDFSRPGKIIFEPIRGFDRIGQCVSLVASIALDTYRQLLRFYRPEEVQQFSKRYVERWRSRYTKIPTPVVETIALEL
jgi:hypothetical protein